MTDTKTRLLAATVETLVEGGLGAATARSIAGRADVNQALVFYHFGSVNALVAAAATTAVDDAVTRHRAALQATRSLTDLLDVGRHLNDAELATGNIAVMSQVLAGGRHDPVLAEAGRYGMTAWRTEIAATLHRLLDGHPLAPAIDIDALAGAVCAGFIGIELYEGVDEAAAASALVTLETLARLVDTLDGLGPLASAAVRRTVTRRP